MSERIISGFQDIRKDDDGRYYCIAENKFGHETVNGLLLVRRKDFLLTCTNTDIIIFWSMAWKNPL